MSTEVSSLRLSTMSRMTYFPSLPPKAPVATQSYDRAVHDAPYTALLGIVVDGKQPDRHPVSSRCRMRTQIGLSNRWRLPEALVGDLLGTAQAIRSIQRKCTSDLKNNAADDHSKSLINPNDNEENNFKYASYRPKREPLHSEDMPIYSKSVGRAHRGSKQLAKSTPGRLNSIGALKQYAPPTARLARPLDIFQYYTKRGQSYGSPDVLFSCLGMTWELHRPFLRKAETLLELLEKRPTPKPKPQYRNKMSENIDNYINSNEAYSEEYRSISSRLSKPDKEDIHEEERKAQEKIAARKKNPMSLIELDIYDPSANKQALAVTLGNLYQEEIEVDINDVVGVMACAYALKFHHLKNGCADMMLRSINAYNVCSYYEAGVKYHQEHVAEACGKWLELNLVPKMAAQIQLRQIPMQLMQRLLSSERLFTYAEYSICKILAYWVFLQVNPHLQLMPSFSSILTYFNSYPKNCAFIEREEGQMFAPLFKQLRLHGITDITHMQDVKTMNLVPQDWIVKTLADQCQALQGGGDMPLLLSFDTGAIRQGFVMEEEPHYHSDIFSLFGFHFELKACKQTVNNAYSFSIQRLKPSDPMLSFRQCERQTFSMRNDREVRYSIGVQWFDSTNRCLSVSTGIKNQKFGLGPKTGKSEVLTIENLRTPVYVTYSILFPPS